MDGVNDVHTNSLLFFPETSTSMLTNSWLFENLIHWHTLLKTLLVLQFQEKFLSLFINTVFRLIGAQTLQSHVHRLPKTEEIIYRLRPPTKNRLESGKLEIVWKIKHTKAIWIVSVSVKIHFLFASHVSESEHLLRTCDNWSEREHRISKQFSHQSQVMHDALSNQIYSKMHKFIEILTFKWTDRMKE